MDCNFKNALRIYRKTETALTNCPIKRNFISLLARAKNINAMRRSSGMLSARGWHKDHYNYNKAEKHERTPALRRTPARNVTRTGAKRKRATSIKKYKR